MKLEKGEQRKQRPRAPVALTQVRWILSLSLNRGFSLLPSIGKRGMGRPGSETPEKGELWGREGRERKDCGKWSEDKGYEKKVGKKLGKRNKERKELKLVTEEKTRKIKTTSKTKRRKI